MIALSPDLQAFSGVTTTTSTPFDVLCVGHSSAPPCPVADSSIQRVIAVSSRSAANRGSDPQKHPNKKANWRGHGSAPPGDLTQRVNLFELIQKNHPRLAGEHQHSTMFILGIPNQCLVTNPGYLYTIP